MAISRTILFGTTAFLLAGTAADAQEACSTYKVAVGDNLRYIARAAYGDSDLYRVIFDANVAVIGEKADLIEIGTVLTIPCDPAAPAVTAAATETPVETATETVTPVAPTTATAAPAMKPISLVTGNGYAPFADEMLPGGGMMTQLVEMGVFRADPSMASAASYPNRCPTIADSTKANAGSMAGTDSTADAAAKRSSASVAITIGVALCAL